MTPGRPAPQMTIPQFLASQDPEGCRSELLFGRLVISPNPKPLPVEVASNILGQLLRLLDRQFAVRGRTHLQFDESQSMPSPDVFVISFRQWRQALEQHRYPLGPPILAVEVISEANPAEHVRQKTALYLEGGAAQVWQVDPEQQRVVVCERDRPAWLVTVHSPLVLPAPLPRVTVPTGSFFRWWPRTAEEKGPENSEATEPARQDGQNTSA